MSILKTQKLCKTYGSGDIKVEALKETSIEIEKGKLTAIVGASGSGKSTLLHLIGGVDKPTEGKVIVNGTDIFSLNEKKLSVFRRRNIGFIFQFFNLIPVLTARENIALPYLLDNRKPDNKYIDEIISILGLEKQQKQLPSQLSGGQQQRVSIGRALAYRPSIILADEPTGNLDTKNSRDILELLRVSVEKFHQTIVVVTHDENITEASDRVMVLEDGYVIRDEVLRK